MSTTRPKFDPKKMMQVAIEAMRKSVAEPRGDGDTPPKVGAVLIKPTGKIESAFRGELRDGDHAEYTLLERKNRDAALDGSVLFATLEPCAPGCRKHPKVACAERIVNARIREVWVGHQDPHPKVAGRGLEYLKEKGVTIHMFDREFQEVIKEENKEFFKEAEEKAEKEKQEKEIILSEYEKPTPGLNLASFSDEALTRYKSFLGINGAIDSPAFLQRLEVQGLVEKTDGSFTPTGFGAMLFGKHPRDLIPQAGLLGTIRYADGREEFRDFDGPLVLIPDDVIQWIRDKLPNPVTRSSARREEENKSLYELVREAVVNALVHRDYDFKGSKCQLIITPNTIVVQSPGKPLLPTTVEQLQSFNAPMISRNPRLHSVFGKMQLAEERGLGLKSFEGRAKEAGLPLPKFAWDDPYLTLTIYRNRDGATKALSAEVFERMIPEERPGWEFLAGRTSTTQNEYVTGMKVPPRTAQRHLLHFVELGLLRRVGRGRATKYVRE